MSARSEAVKERISAFNPRSIVDPEPRPPYTPQEEALFKVLREHARIDPIFLDKWNYGRTSPADIVIVLAGYGVTP